MQDLLKKTNATDASGNAVLGDTEDLCSFRKPVIVHKDYQNKGIGTQLLTDVLVIIKEEGCTYVIMQSNNPTVQHIAKKVGLTNSLSDMRIDFIQTWGW